MKLHPDEQVVTDIFLAAYVNYLGFDCLKCTTPNREFTQWTFLVPEFDLRIMQDEISDPETAIMIKGYVAAFQSMAEYRKAANRNGGEWTSTQWREIVQGRPHC
jgi:hypothetical protein